MELLQLAGIIAAIGTYVGPIMHIHMVATNVCFRLFQCAHGATFVY